MNIWLSFTHLQVVLKLYDFILGNLKDILRIYVLISQILLCIINTKMLVYSQFSPFVKDVNVRFGSNCSFKDVLDVSTRKQDKILSN